MTHPQKLFWGAFAVFAFALVVLPQEFAVVFAITTGSFALLLWVVFPAGFQPVDYGKRFVRAIDFLTLLNGGASVAEANRLAALLFTPASNPNMDYEAIQRAERLRRVWFEGKQLPAIQLARSKGFTG